MLIGWGVGVGVRVTVGVKLGAGVNVTVGEGVWLAVTVSEGAAVILSGTLPPEMPAVPPQAVQTTARRVYKYQ
jgi:hypothetical protein